MPAVPRTVGLAENILRYYPQVSRGGISRNYDLTRCVNNVSNLVMDAETEKAMEISRRLSIFIGQQNLHVILLASNYNARGFETS